MIKKSVIVFLTLLWTTSAFGGSIKVDPQLSNYSKHWSERKHFQCRIRYPEQSDDIME